MSVRVTPRGLMRCESRTLILRFIGPWSLVPLLKCVYNDDAVIFHCRFSSHWKWVISHRELVLAALWGRSENHLYPPWLHTGLHIDAPLIYYLPSAEHVFKCGDTGGERSSRTRTVINRQAAHPWAHPTPRLTPFPCRRCWSSMPRLAPRAGRLSHVFWEDFMAQSQILQAKEPNITAYSRL